MAKLVWNETGKRFYEWGIDRVVLYPANSEGIYQNGVAWNGVTKILETPSGFESRAYYMDSRKYITLSVKEEFAATIEAISAPKEFAACDGTTEIMSGVSLQQQSRNMFGLSYRTYIGNDVAGKYFGYKLHLVYGAFASAWTQENKTISGEPNCVVFNWPVSTVGLELSGFNPVASLVIDSTKIDERIIQQLETVLYGTDEPSIEPRLPLPLEVIMSSYPLFTVGVTSIGRSQIDPFN